MKRGGIISFFRLNPEEQKLLFAAFWQLFRCRIYFLLLPYPKLERKFRQRPDATQENPELAQKIRVAIRRASKLSFWKNKCLVQTFAARVLLNNRKLRSTAFLGVQTDGSTPDFAHAWIVSGNIEVVPAIGGYVQAHTF